jgi:heme-degrading monooxygenase HmoA
VGSEHLVFARFGWTDTDAGSLDQVVAAYDAAIVPQVSQVGGFLGTFACADRSSGRCVVVTLWRDEEAMTAHERSTAPGFIAQAVDATGVPVPIVEDCEVVLWKVDDEARR